MIIQPVPAHLEEHSAALQQAYQHQVKHINLESTAEATQFQRI